MLQAFARRPLHFASVQLPGCAVHVCLLALVGRPWVRVNDAPGLAARAADLSGIQAWQSMKIAAMAGWWCGTIPLTVAP